MKQKMKEKVVHSIMAMLLSAGIIMPVLGALDSSLAKPKLLLIKKILKAHKREAIQIMAILDGEKPETYDLNLLKIPMKMLEIVNDPEIQSLFTYQGQTKE